jgi:hypothetical protein
MLQVSESLMVDKSSGYAQGAFPLKGGSSWISVLEVTEIICFLLSAVICEGKGLTLADLRNM